jgi:hypothetical protein
MGNIRQVIQDVLDRKGAIAIKRLSLKVGADLTQVLSGSLPASPTLEAKVATAVRELGF